jgi:hypothetical protein
MHRPRTACIHLAALCVAGFALAACGSGSGADDDEAEAGAGASGASGSTDSGAGAGNGSGAGGSGASGSGGAPSFEGTTRVDSGSGTAETGSADVSLGPDGSVYVARSTDGGQTFGAAVQVDGAGLDPLVSMGRHPYVAADEERVAVVFNDEGGTIHLYVSPATDSLSFGEGTTVGSDVPTEFRDYPKPLFLADGSLVVAWQGYPSTGARIFLSREGSGFDSEEASAGAPGVPCECCSLDITATTGGDLMVAFRNNDGNVREMWAASAPGAGAFSSWAPISTSEGTLDACPMQGPRLGQTGEAAHVAVWSARGADAGSVYFATTSDGGASWSGGAPAGSFVGDEPTLAVAPSGRLYVTAITGSGKSALAWSDDGGGSWSEPEALQSPDGALAVPQVESGGGMSALAAVSSAGTVWLRRME